MGLWFRVDVNELNTGNFGEQTKRETKMETGVGSGA